MESLLIDNGRHPINEGGPVYLMDLEAKDNVIPFEKPKKFELITGGAAPPENWLADLVDGTIFLARDRTKGGQHPALVLEAYMIANQALPEATNLYLKTPDGSSIDIWVPTLEFSRRKEMIKVLAIANPKEEEENNGSEGTLQPE